MGRSGARIASVTPLDLDERLFVDAREEGYRFMDRLRSDWAAGTNRFDGAGELLLGAYVAKQCVGVGGLNIDPFAGDPATGRVRHVYVAPSHRSMGIGHDMCAALLHHAAGWFAIIRLRTDNPAAARLYERLGFARVAQPDATHVLQLTLASRRGAPT